MLELLVGLGVPYDIHVLHDYAWLCGRVALVGPAQHYCGEPAVAQCEACVADAGNLIDEDITVAALRRRGYDPELAYPIAAWTVPGGIIGARVYHVVTDWERFSKDNLIATEDEIAGKVEAALEAGADYIIFYVPGVAYDLDLVTRMEQITKRFA